MASPSADRYRINPASLAEKFLTSLGIACILAEPVAGPTDRVRLMVRGVEARKSPYPRVWLRSPKEIARIQHELLAGSRHASKARGHIVMAVNGAVAVDIIRAYCQLNGIRPIRDEDMAATFDSLLARLKIQLDRLQRAGVIAQIRAEYSQIVAAGTAGTSKLPAIDPENVPSIVPVKGSQPVLVSGTMDVGQSRDNGTNGTSAIPEYLDWVVAKLAAIAPIGRIHAIVIEDE